MNKTFGSQPKLADVAQRTGVSANTVSCVLRGTGRTSERTRRIVLAEARKLGYRPNGAARATATGRFGCIALLLSTDPRRSTLPRPLLEGLQAGLDRHQMHLALAMCSDEKLSSQDAVPELLRNSMSDGFLINYTHRIPQQLTQIVDDSGLPAVWLNTRRSTNCVYLNDFAASRDLTRHLLELGHRRIDFADTANVQSEGALHYSFVERLAGYEDAMRSAGCVPRSARRYREDESRLSVIDALLGAPQPPTAVITYGPMDAHAFMFRAAARGLKVPDDLSLATFDNRMTDYLGLSFTVSLVPEFEAGRRAVDLFVQRFHCGSGHVPAEVVPFGFQQGQSTCPPRVSRTQ